MSFSVGVVIDPSEAKSQYSTSQGRPLGTRAETPDGRVFRWALNGGTALGMGIPVQAAAIYELDKDTAYTAPINDTEDISTTWRSFTVESETATGEIAANEYADGFVRVAYSTASNAMGQMVVIKSNDASATSSTDALGSTMTITIADNDALTASLDTGAVVTLHHNPYWKTVVCAGGAAEANLIVGVPIRPVSASYYYWAQTWGPCVVIQDGVLVAGQRVQISTDTDEAVSVLNFRTSTNSTFLAGDTDADAGIGFIHAVAAVKQTIGYAMGSPGQDQKAGLIFLTLSP